MQGTGSPRPACTGLISLRIASVLVPPPRLPTWFSGLDFGGRPDVPVQFRALTRIELKWIDLSTCVISQPQNAELLVPHPIQAVAPLRLDFPWLSTRRSVIAGGVNAISASPV